MGNSQLKDALLHRTGAADARAEGRGQDNGAGMPGGGEPHHDGGAANVSGTITDPSVGAQEGEPMLKDERYEKDDCSELLHPLLPILEDYMIEMLPAYATVAFSGLTMFHLMVANNVCPSGSTRHRTVPVVHVSLHVHPIWSSINNLGDRCYKMSAVCRSSGWVLAGAVAVYSRAWRIYNYDQIAV
ncbi:uncharacterized protein LOC104581339 isoform X2 [Brachypodium distachyon]|uniref:uncharacterized protein LOC104581339 isoform X2 n=1 Tax=Brachypodium distachyon TaxID=15368 RepID=UPI000D0D5DC6|nr:uncharacterized protein LOC104581339 isoform X2 [Brachypodium distachyon]|eukprot:XP_024315044.1 uncharacterized protein LOC104581339 isoform X2 [Brachypodium distachyon]